MPKPLKKQRERKGWIIKDESLIDGLSWITTRESVVDIFRREKNYEILPITLKL